MRPNTAKTILEMATLLFVVITAADGATAIESTAVSYDIELDGAFPEWEGMQVVYLEESIRVLSVAHDSDNLYLMFRFSDRQLAREIMRRGVLIWVNGDGKNKKKKEEFAVRYPGSAEIADHLSSERPEEGAAGAGQQGWRPPAGLAEMRPVPGELTVVRFGIKEIISADAAEGIGAGSAVVDEAFRYEVRIPISEIGGKVASADSGKDRKLAVGIQIGGMTRAEMEMLQSAMKQRRGDMGGMGSMGGSRGGGGMGGMGGAGGMGGMGSPGSMGGGGMGGGRGSGGSGGDMKDQMDPEIEWLTVTLRAPG